MSTTLLTYSGPVEPTGPGPRIGGIPLLPADLAWPVCSTCSGPQQFLAQLPADATGGGGRTVLAFMCANDPGLCDEWDPASGGNAALVVRGPLSPAQVPDTGATLLDGASGVTLISHDGGYDAARAAHEHQHGPRTVLGQLGGQPAWVQGDETPGCPACEARMTLVAQLEEGHGSSGPANYGGGCAYVFTCGACDRGAFLFQC